MKESEIKHFNRLLELYYSGTASTEEEQELMLIAEKTDPESMPEELRGDVSMLRDLSDFHHDATAFASFLDELTLNKKQPTPHPRRKIHVWIGSLIAAAAAIAATVVFVDSSGTPQATGVRTETTTLLAENRGETSPQKSEEPTAKASSPHLLSLPSEEGAEKPVSATTRAKATHRREKQKPTPAPQTPKEIEVRDPEVAARLVEQSLNLLAENISISNRSIAESTQLLQSTIQEAETKFNTILL